MKFFFVSFQHYGWATIKERNHEGRTHQLAKTGHSMKMLDLHDYWIAVVASIGSFSWGFCYAASVLAAEG